MSAKKYPFSTNKNQHNFYLIANRCSNLMYDMDMGETPYDEKEYDRLEHLKERADYYIEKPLPVVYLTWPELKEARELVDMAINIRMGSCIARGRYDLLEYCN